MDAREIPLASVDALFDEGLERFGVGDYGAAVKLMREVLAVQPGHRDAAHGLIRALDRAGRSEEAIQVATALIEREPEDVLARTSLSMVYQRMGRIAEAEKVGTEAKILGWKMELKGTERERRIEGSGEPQEEQIARWFVASTNAGKLRDFALASGGRVRLEVLPGLGGIVAPAEDEDTFEGNASVKARYYSGFAPGEIVVADDSGLEVDGLGGAPGVRSARYAEDLGFGGEGSLDERNNACLLEALVGVEVRSARYRCVLVAARDGVVLGIGVGSVEGRILEVRRGSGGFGYDPLFYVEEQGRAMAEMDGETRLGLSHRGRALKELVVRMGA